MSLVDILIICIFLYSTLYVGIRSGKKIKTFGDYAIGSRNFSDFAICCTVVATFIGGNSTIGNIGKFYDVGIVQFLAQIGELFNYIIIGVFLVRKFKNYYGCYSLGDMFFKAYGTYGKILVGTVGFAYVSLITGMQFTAMGITINVLTNFSYLTSLFISTGIILIYTGRGGVRAVTFTDVLQFMVLILAMPILLVIVLKDIGGLNALMAQVPQTHLTISDENFHRYLFLMFPMMLPILSPVVAQRLLMTKNDKQGTKAYYSMSCVFMIIVMISLLLGFAAKILLPDLPKGDSALLALVTHYLPSGVLGVAVIGILAVLMSSADSALNAGSVILINDIIIPSQKKELSEKTKLKMARNASLIIGIVAIFVASQGISLFEIWILISTLWFSVILSPLYFLLFNMKVPLKGLFTSAVIGFSTAVLWTTYLKPITHIDGMFPGFFLML